MPYNNAILRAGAGALIPEEYSDEILKGLTNESAALSLFRSIPMSTAQTRMPVLSALPTAYFVNGDTGLKQTTEVAWANKYLNAEEIACIVPIPEAVLEDSSYDLWGMAVPLIQQAMGRTLDAAIFFGTNKPASWPDDIRAGITAAGHNVARGTNAAAAGGLAADFSDAFALVEADGMDVNGILANTTYKGRLRNARETTGAKLQEVNAGSAYGTPITYALRGQWPAPAANAVEVILGDFTQGIIGKRKDFTAKVLDQAVITDNTGAVVYNLAQQDMVALRVVMRVAFQVANTINYDNANSATRYPWAAIRQGA